jgi:hypothetical protein
VKIGDGRCPQQHQPGLPLARFHPAMLLLAFAIRLAVSDWGNIEADEKNEYWGVVYALPIAGVVIYLFICSIGWFIAELVD